MLPHRFFGVVTVQSLDSAVYKKEKTYSDDVFKDCKTEEDFLLLIITKQRGVTIIPERFQSQVVYDTVMDVYLNLDPERKRYNGVMIDNAIQLLDFMLAQFVKISIWKKLIKWIRAKLLIY